MLAEFEARWLKLIFHDYFQSESTYFSQIFTNTVGPAIYKASLRKYVSEADYLKLLTGLRDISHLRPFDDLWGISRAIRNSKESLAFWTSAPLPEMKEALAGKSREYFLPELREHLKKYGYHSDKELDVSEPHYAEEPSSVILALKEATLLADESSPLIEQEKQGEIYRNELNKLAQTVKPSKYRSLVKQIEEMRAMLWWREEFRDISTRFYYLNRLYTLQLARYYVEEGIISAEADIWFLKIADLQSFINKKISSDELKALVEKNKLYYNSFRNYNSEGEIGGAFYRSATVTAKSELKGIGCNSGVTSGTARVIEDFSEIASIELGDILVTKFTDTGWTRKFAILKGIVTEYGGTLCHAAIVAREYGIPCIVSATDITKKIKDGSLIRIDGGSGAIEILGEK
jgi:pyruvate,water dikinase